MPVLNLPSRNLNNVLIRQINFPWLICVILPYRNFNPTCPWCKEAEQTVRILISAIHPVRKLK
ncbi:MAG: DsbA family protein [Candidatus Edwardsbacteria bacterium]